MSEILNKQTKKNLRNRFLKLHKSINEKSKYNIGFQFLGSLAKGSGPVIIKKGEKSNYDLDADFIIKTDDSDDAIVKDVLRWIGESIRGFEKLELRDEVVRINVDRDGYHYHFDIAIKRYSSEKKLRISK